MKTLRERMAEPSFGAWVSSDPLSCEIMGGAGYDWLILETQHRNVAPSGVLSALHAVELGRTPLLVRVGGVVPTEIERALDIGAAGVVVPMVNTAEQARIVADSVLYPPHGKRSFGQVRAYAPSGKREDPVCVLMIETVEALDNLDAITSVPGIDALLVGPADLALSMGLPPSPDIVPQMAEAMKRVVAACQRNGVVPGCASYGMDNARILVDLGVKFISVGADGSFLRRGVQAEGAAIAKLHREIASGTVAGQRGEG